MANLCTRSIPDGATVNTANYVPTSSGGSAGTANNVPLYSVGSVRTGSAYLIEIPIGGAFDAERYGISCQAFSNAAVSVVSLQSSMTNLQTQVTALVSGSEVRAPNPEVIEAQAIVFGAVLTAGVLIWGMKRIYNLFMHPVDRGDKE